MPTTNDLPPGRTGLPFIGETLSFLRSPKQFAESRRARHGDVFRTHLLGNPTVFISGAEGNRWIFAGEERYLKNRWTAPIRMLLGARCTSMLEGDAHRSRRKLLAPHFTRAAAEASIPMIERLTREHVARWPLEDDLRLIPAMKALAFEIATTVLVGTLPGAMRDELARDFDQFVEGFFVAIPVAVPGGKLRRALDAKARLLARIRTIVAERAARCSVIGEASDVLSTLLGARDDSGMPLDHEAIADELLLFLFAGHDTTVTSTTNALVHLALHPEVLARARVEQDALGAGPLTKARVDRAEWLSQTINESMRLVPPVNGAFRVTTEDTQFAGRRIPAGWTVVLGAVASHSDPKAFADPERFDPDRFGPERAEHKRTPLAFIPFGGGPRLCIGQHFAMLEMQVMLALMVRDWQWTLRDPSRLRWTLLPFARPADGGRVTWARRAPVA